MHIVSVHNKGIFLQSRSIPVIVSLFFNGLQNITISMIIIYFLFFYLLSFNLTNLLNLVIKYLTSHRNKSKLMHVHDILREVECNINEFDSLFLVIPFLAFTIILTLDTYQVLLVTTETVQVLWFI